MDVSLQLGRIFTEAAHLNYCSRTGSKGSGTYRWLLNLPPSSSEWIHLWKHLKRASLCPQMQQLDWIMVMEFMTRMKFDVFFRAKISKWLDKDQFRSADRQEAPLSLNCKSTVEGERVLWNWTAVICQSSKQDPSNWGQSETWAGTDGDGFCQAIAPYDQALEPIHCYKQWPEETISQNESVETKTASRLPVIWVEKKKCAWYY